MFDVTNFQTTGLKMPKALAKFVIFVEMLQLIVGVVLNLYATWVKCKKTIKITYKIEQISEHVNIKNTVATNIKQR